TSSKFIHTWLRFGEIMRGSLRTEPQDRSLAINNPQLSADVKTAWLKEDPSLLLFVEQPDLSQLRDLVKTGATRKIRSEARHRLEEKQ
uniref:DUF2773 domain-containing protein n=1 Tax=Escherichia coli TaxID=562 RepID=UPI001FCD368D